MWLAILELPRLVQKGQRQASLTPHARKTPGMGHVLYLGKRSKRVGGCNGRMDEWMSGRVGYVMNV